MWIIAGGIAIAMGVVVAVDGVSGIPFQGLGIVGGCVLAAVAFSLGYAD
jgi:hypothetical protein